MPQAKGIQGKKLTLILVCLALAIMIVIAFGPLKDCKFVTYDDHVYVKENYFIQSDFNWNSINWAFSFESVMRGGNWNPIIWLSLMCDYELFGLNPPGYHLVNLFFHLLNTILLFLILFKITRELWKSAFVAALFAIHPLHVESVAWIAERKDVLSTFFFMMTIGAYVFYIEHKTVVRYVATCIFFVLGLMSKTMLVSLPFVLILLDYWPLGRLQWSLPAGRTWVQIRKLLLEKIPLFTLSVFFSVIAIISQKRGGYLDLYIPLTARVSNAFRSYVIYLYKTAWPLDLAFFYPYPTILPPWQIVGSAFILIVVSFCVLWKIKKYPYLAIGWLWYLGTLMPVIGIIQIGSQAYADRYTYIPLIGIFLMFVWAISGLSIYFPYRQKILSIGGAVLLSCLAAITYIQTRYWQDALILNTHAIQITENNYTAYNMRGFFYDDLGNYRQAISNYDKSIEISPNYADAYNNRGIAYASLGNYKQVIDDFDRAIKINPHKAEAYYNRGVAYHYLGDYSQTINDFNRAIEIDPNYANAYYNRAATYNELGNQGQSIEDLKMAAKCGHRDAQNILINQGINW
jgi:tetratricopeptide (TPR) repeat protein